MEYKPGWAAVQEHMTGWWHGEDMVLAVHAPRDEPLFDAPPPKAPDDPRERWLDVDFRIAHSESAIARTYYGGDAFPAMNHYLGPGCVALYLGCEGDFFNCEDRFGGTDTIWFKPCIDDPDAAPDLPFDPDNVFWRHHMRMIGEAVRRADGGYEVGIPDMVENIDILASLRGMAEVLTDMLDRPEFVHRFQRRILELWFRYFDEIFETVKGPDGGCSFQTYALWAPGTMAKVQCDLGAMISPGQFREFVQPYLAEHCDRLDFSMFHLDGPHCTCHVDALMEIDSLNAVQWTPGSGQEGMGSPKWYPLYEKIRGAGKSLQLLGTQPHEIPGLLKRFGREGLFISTGARTETEARELLSEYGRS